MSHAVAPLPRPKQTKAHRKARRLILQREGACVESTLASVRRVSSKGNRGAFPTRFCTHENFKAGRPWTWVCVGFFCLFQKRFQNHITPLQQHQEQQQPAPNADLTAPGTSAPAAQCRASTDEEVPDPRREHRQGSRRRAGRHDLTPECREKAESSLATDTLSCCAVETSPNHGASPRRSGKYREWRRWRRRGRESLGRDRERRP